MVWSQNKCTLSCKLARETISQARWFFSNSKNAPSSQYIKYPTSYCLCCLMSSFFFFLFFLGLLQTRPNVFSCNPKLEKLKPYYLHESFKEQVWLQTFKHVWIYLFQVIMWWLIRVCAVFKRITRLIKIVI